MARYNLRGPGGRFVDQRAYDDAIQLMMSSTIQPHLIMKDIAKQLDGDAKKKIGKYIRNMQKSVAAEQGLDKMNRKVAKGAQEAILEAYLGSGIGSRKSYRQNDIGKLRRYSAGAMERAIKDPNFAIGRGHSIWLVNSTLMDKKAKQWYRLNFGASPGGSTDPNVGEMKFPRSLGGRNSKRKAQFKGFKPSPTFNVPQRGLGVWSSTFLAGSGGDIKPVKAGAPGKGALYVGRVSVKREPGKRVPFFKSQPTKTGIQGKRFLDAGARYINDVYPKELSKVARQWMRDAKKGIR